VDIPDDIFKIALIATQLRLPPPAAVHRAMELIVLPGGVVKDLEDEIRAAIEESAN
jgi:hypothetical protein